jgi:release factor glutamine methyltransferase
MSAHLTIADSLRAATEMLAGHSDSPRLDAELLLGKVAAKSRAALIVAGDTPLAADLAHRYGELLAARRAGAPIAYLTGTREFWSLDLDVTPDVLVPRPETETLVETVLALTPANRACAILDLGTGSGAIALALASERPMARITATDLSAQALAVAAANERKLGFSRITWRQGSWFAAVSGEQFDLIVSNPPYVAAGDVALESLRAEPRLALTPGDTGYEAFAAIIAGARQHLRSGGWLAFEHGHAQANELATMLADQGFLGIRTVVDTAALPRVTLGRLGTPTTVLTAADFSSPISSTSN